MCVSPQVDKQVRTAVAKLLFDAGKLKPDAKLALPAAAEKLLAHLLAVDTVR